MSTFARKGLSAILLVVLFAAPVAAAAPGGERVESREAGLVARWVAELVEWVEGWWMPVPRERDRATPDRGETVRALSAADGSDGQGGYDPNG